MSATLDVSALDLAVAAAARDLAQRRTPAPEALFFLATGVGMLPAHLRQHSRLPLGQLSGMPAAWSQVMLHVGEIHGLTVWMIEDAPGPQEHGTNPSLDEAPWVRGFPCWLAANAGAFLCVHTSAGLALAASGSRVEPGMLAIARDHINLSGRTPLIGLGNSKLGPLFPDPSRLHHVELRSLALAHARELGVKAVEAVVACTVGPAMETAAERAYWAKTGAEIAVQNLAVPLLSAAHAGLSVLSITAITDDGEATHDVGAVVAETDRLAPALEDLLVHLAPDVKRIASELGADA